MRALFGTLLLAAGETLFAQQTQFWQPEVRRAVPVQSPAPASSPTPPAAPRAVPVQRPASTPPPRPPAEGYQNPAWMEKVAPTPTPTPSYTPEPGFTPYRPQGRIEVAPTPPSGEEGDIRLSPSTLSGEAAAAEELRLANSIYSRKMYDYATQEYEKFLISYPGAKGRDMALFRLAECHRMLGNDDAARIGYERLLREFRKGEFAGAGAYRLGEFLYAEKKFDPALIQFRIASAEAGEEEIRLSAKFNAARCLDRLKRRDEAAKLYQEVAAVEQKNPYLLYSKLALAELAAAGGRKKDALEQFSAIADTPGPGNVRAEAAVKAAALAAELNDQKRALKLFETALELDPSGDWKPMAVLGALRLNYELGEHKKVAAMAQEKLDNLPPETRAEVLLLAGNSLRQLGDFRAARATYDRLLAEFPNAKPSENARFHRLVSMYQLDDPKLIKEADEFLRRSSNPKERAQVSLLKAEALFKSKEFGEAGPIYAKLSEAELSPELKMKALYKLGWCQAQTGDHAEAIKTFTAYIEKNPESPTLPAAILQRGLARQQEKDYAAATKDFEQIIETWRDAPEREIALQQKALIQGQQQDYKGMTATFGRLLEEYPKTSGTGQANFWIGWAAFEEKDYKGAIEKLEIARKTDPAQYGERASLRIILCYYYLEDRPALKRAIAENKNLTIPVEITRWLGRKAFEEGDYSGAEKYLLPVAKDSKTVEPEVLIELAEAQIALGKTREAAPYVARYVDAARQPFTRARGLLAQAAVALADRKFDDARKLCDEALLLQPEGRLNADARLMAGEASFARGDYDGAARTFMTVAVLYDDPSVTPRALRRAAEAYRKADNLLEAEKALHELEQRFPEALKTPKISREQS